MNLEEVKVINMLIMTGIMIIVIISISSFVYLAEHWVKGLSYKRNFQRMKFAIYKQISIRYAFKEAERKAIELSNQYREYILNI